ncbi:MAG: hypothetical protein Q8L34_02470 [Candidatus Woesearchaeota archaeon]|nr:hypothetical protein [Candidatus Woesearchaeota archaeon]
MTTITVPRMKHLQDVPGYQEFVQDLETTCNLHDLQPEALRWADIQPGLVSLDYPPNIVVNIAPDTPQLAVALHPTQDGNPITVNATYHTPLLLRDVGRWGSSPLQRHQITRWRGRSDAETFFTKKQSYPLAEFLENLVEGISDSTPVVDVAALFPISPQGKYATEFCPVLQFDSSGHRDYAVSVIMEGGFSFYKLLSRGQSVGVLDIDKDQKQFKWKVDAVRDLSDIDQLMLPSSVGHMVLLVQPVEEQRPPGLFRDSDSSRHTFGSDNPMRSMRGASIGAGSISQGSSSGQGKLYGGSLASSKRGHAVIYHITALTVKPDTIEQLRTTGLGQLHKTLDTFVQE